MISGVSPVSGWAYTSSGLALAASTRELALAVQAGVELWPGWAAPLADALADRKVAAVQPLVLAGDGTLA